MCKTETAPPFSIPQFPVEAGFPWICEKSQFVTVTEVGSGEEYGYGKLKFILRHSSSEVVEIAEAKAGIQQTIIDGTQ
jgi:hypothetical protein